MEDILIASIATGVLTGTSTALLIIKVILPGRAEPQLPKRKPTRSTFDADAVANEWASTAGRPGFAPFLANKLRTADTILRRREHLNINNNRKGKSWGR